MRKLRIGFRLLAVLGVVFTYRSLFPQTLAKACEIGRWGGNTGCMACGCLENQPYGYNDCEPGSSCGSECGGGQSEC
jgi:hypothetical protein